MKKYLQYAITINYFLLLSFTIFAQVKQDNDLLYQYKDAIIIDIDTLTNAIFINADDNDVTLKMTSKTKLKTKNGKTVFVKEMSIGTEATLKYKLTKGERIVEEIKIDTEMEGAKVNFTGLFEAVENGFALIDGRRVMLAPKFTFKGSTSKNCKCAGAVYSGFDDILLKIGTYMEVQGIYKKDGTVAAKHIEVCRNTFTSIDNECRLDLEKQLVTQKMEIVPSKLFANGLVRGNVSVQGIEYKLSDDIKMQAYINMVGQPLVPQHMQDKTDEDIDFKFFVLDYPVPTAYSLQNGMVFISTGLLNTLENEAQLAYVLSHEIAHVTHEHGVHRYNLFLKLRLAKDILTIAAKGASLSKKVQNIQSTSWSSNQTKNTENINANTAQNPTQAPIDNFQLPTDSTNIPSEYKWTKEALKISNQVINLIDPAYIANLYDSKRELQADRIALYHISRLGYDVSEVPKFWKTIMSKTNDESFAQQIMTNINNFVTTNEDFKNSIDTQSFNQSLKAFALQQILTSVYTKPSLEMRRFKSIVTLLNTHYKNKNIDKKIIQTENFKKMKQLLGNH